MQITDATIANFVTFGTESVSMLFAVIVSFSFFYHDRAERQPQSVDDMFLEGGEKNRMKECGAWGLTAGYNCHLLELRLQQQEVRGKKEQDN